MKRHCACCHATITELVGSWTEHPASACHGVECASYAEKDAEIVKAADLALKGQRCLFTPEELTWLESIGGKGYSRAPTINMYTNLKAACAEKDAEIARLTAELDVIRQERDLLQDPAVIGEDLLERIEVNEPDAVWDTTPTELYVEAVDERARLRALVAVGREMADALEKWNEARRAAVRGFSEREPGVMTDFKGTAISLLTQSIQLDKAREASDKWRSLDTERT